MLININHIDIIKVHYNVEKKSSQSTADLYWQRPSIIESHCVIDCVIEIFYASLPCGYTAAGLNCIYRSGFQQLLFVVVAQQNYCILPLTNLLAPIYIIVITQSFWMQMQIRIQRHWTLVCCLVYFNTVWLIKPLITSFLHYFAHKNCNNTKRMTFTANVIY